MLVVGAGCGRVFLGWVNWGDWRAWTGDPFGCRVGVGELGSFRLGEVDWTANAGLGAGRSLGFEADWGGGWAGAGVSPELSLRGLELGGVDCGWLFFGVSLCFFELFLLFLSSSDWEGVEILGFFSSSVCPGSRLGVLLLMLLLLLFASLSFFSSCWLAAGAGADIFV